MLNTETIADLEVEVLAFLREAGGRQFASEICACVYRSPETTEDDHSTAVWVALRSLAARGFADQNALGWAEVRS